eukprot:TRINITY_DN64424_c0_g1_i1.p1 TRINITY_DN64424_c0_g1~~TRINITY_DN64424_c0_g1_i1.p1  ORF type:complete len:148 (-),score=35.90 TRINITY_DN64424_c0_g1_i1:118-561(-)
MADASGCSRAESDSQEPAGCRQRPQFSGPAAAASSSSCGGAAEATDGAGQAGSGSSSSYCGHDAFMFPSALKSSDLDLQDGKEEASDEDEDTDGPVVEQKTVLDSIYQAKIFTDPEEQEKWKARGWRAAQCCGGALLVLALIFDELD